MSKVMIKVTGDDIMDGAQADPYSCPVALAASRAVSGWADVGPTTLVVSKYSFTNTGIEIDLPAEVIERIKNYDKTGKMTPFEFEIELPD